MACLACGWSYPLLGVQPSISIVKLIMIGYCCNHLDGQLNYWVFTHWLIGVTIMYQLCYQWFSPSTMAWQRNSWYASPELWRMHSRKRNVASTAAAQIISSEIVHWWNQPERKQFKPQRGDGIKEGSPDPSRKGDSAKGIPGSDAQGIGHHTQTPFLNPNPFQEWYRVKNIARVMVNRESCMALLGNGAQINTIMPSFVKTHSLEVGPLSDLVCG